MIRKNIKTTSRLKIPFCFSFSMKYKNITRLNAIIIFKSDRKREIFANNKNL